MGTGSLSNQPPLRSPTGSLSRTATPSSPNTQRQEQNNLAEARRIARANDVSDVNSDRLPAYVGVSRTDSARQAFADRISNHLRWTGGLLNGDAAKAPDAAKDAVRTLQNASADAGRTLLAKADEQVKALETQVNRLSAGKSPEEAQAIHAHADQLAAQVYQNAQAQADDLMKKTGEKSLEILKKAGKHHDGGVFGMVKSAFKTADKVFDDIKDTVGDVVGEVKKVQDGIKSKVDDFAHDRLQDLQHFADDAIAEHTSLGDIKFKGEKGGELSELVTSRLAIGDSVNLKVTSNVQLGDLPINLGAGGSVQIKRVQATRPDGTPIDQPRDANDHPPTVLQLTLIGQGSGGAGVHEQDGVEVGPIKAGQDIDAQAGIQGQVMIRAQFDPNNQKDMEDLRHALGATGALAATFGTPLGLKPAGDLKDSLKGHVTEVAGDFGNFGVASLNETLGIKLPSFGKDSPLNKIKSLSPTALGLGINASVHVGLDFNVRSGSTTAFATGDGDFRHQEFFGGQGGGRGRTLAVTVDAHDRIAGVQVQDSKRKADFHGPGFEDPQGNFQKGLAKLKDNDVVTTTSAFSPEQLSAFKKELADNPAAAFAHLGEAALDPARLGIQSATSTTQQDIKLGFGAEEAAGSVDLGFAQTRPLSGDTSRQTFGIG